MEGGGGGVPLGRVQVAIRSPIEETGVAISVLFVAIAVAHALKALLRWHLLQLVIELELRAVAAVIIVA